MTTTSNPPAPTMSSRQFLTYDAATGGYELPPEHAVALVDQDSPAFLPGFFQVAYGAVRDATE